MKSSLRIQVKPGKSLAVCAMLLATIFLPFLSFAQRSTPDRLRAVHIDSPIDLDGALDEEVWAKAPRISNFTQKELVENEPATEKTEVAVLFTETDLLDPQAGSKPLLRFQPVRRHVGSPRAHPHQQDCSHDQVRLVLQHEVKPYHMNTSALYF
jgi:hypothetical protein